MAYPVSFTIVCMLGGAVIVSTAGWTGVAVAAVAAAVTGEIERWWRRRRYLND